MIEHLGVCNFNEHSKRAFEVQETDRVLQFANYTFDASVGEMNLALLSGAELYIASEADKLDVHSISNYVKKNNINIACFPPFYYEQSEIELSKFLITGGSQSNRRVVEKALKTGKYVNSYGPTETTASSTHWECSRIEDIPSTIPIGKPIVNTKIYILQGNNFCGVGIPGELCIAGEGLARGYLNQPELTAEKFTDNPFGDGKLYRSGDLARWLPDGNIEYMGRIDEQVKIRGFRIELGEISNLIKEIEGINDCAVIAGEDANGDKEIYAYIVSDAQLDVSLVRDTLAKSVYDYMVPAYIAQIESIPLTRNGKLDKRALPKIEVRLKEEYVAPRTETEEKICGVFKEILSVGTVGVKDSFFELGGNSLRATRLVNLIEAGTGVRIAIKEVFAKHTVEALARLVTGADATTYTPIPKAAAKEYYEMSSAQLRTYLFQQMHPEAVTYNMPYNLRLRGDVRPEAIENALQKLIARHEILRTEYRIFDGKPMQRVLETAEAAFEYIEETLYAEAALTAEFVKPFDLSNASQLRAKLVNMGAFYLLMFDMHHILADGMSVVMLINEFTELYNGQVLKSLTHQYKDYSEWIRTRDLSGQKAYWVREFEGEVPSLDMPFDYVRPQERSYAGAAMSIKTGKELGSQIKELAKKTCATDFMVFLATAMVLLGKYGNQEDVIIGSPISGRTHEDSQNMLGMFVNTLAMRGRPEGNKSFAGFLEEVKTSCLKAYENQEYPFEELVESVDKRHDVSRNPLFDVMLSLQNNEHAAFKMNGVTVEDVETNSTVAKFDFAFDIHEIDGDFKIILEYASVLFKKETAELILEHYVQLLKNVTAKQELMLKEISMTTEKESQRIIGEFNNTATEYPRNRTVVELFEEQVAITPDKAAVVCEDEKLTYRELNAEANRIAGLLLKSGVNKNDYIALTAEKRIESVVGMLGILKAGGAYVPIDINSPFERIRYMLEDCSAKAMLYTDFEIKTNLPTIKVNKSSYSTITNPTYTTSCNDIAYLMYTSGTTGTPKGVMVTHRNIIRLVKNTNFIKLNEKSVILQAGAIAFDASTLEIWGALLNGGEVCLADTDVLTEPGKLKTILLERKINTLAITSALFNNMLDADVEIFSNLQYLMTGGEKVSEFHVRKFIENAANSKVAFSNCYGPTEATTVSTYYPILKDDPILKTPIGRSIANSNCYIMSGEVLCGIGIPGELCLGGDGVAHGYLNQPELTAEKFVDNPFGAGKLYKSGDQARWLPDGNIEYLGRIDEQVKIRGFRIEMGEIESRIREIRGVLDCAAIVREDASGDKAIYAYYTSNESVSVFEIRDKLSETLPKHMMPTFMMQIEAIPVTKNGKLDKKALPDIEFRTEEVYTPPRNEMERVICGVFQEVLGCNKVGVYDNLFELGLNSIKITRAISQLRLVGLEFSIRELFIHQSVNELTEQHSKVASFDSSDLVVEPLIPLTYKNIGHLKTVLSDKMEAFQHEIINRPVVKQYPVSTMQKLTKSLDLEISGTIIHFDHPIDLKILNKSILQLINSQGLLRSVLVKEGSNIYIQEFASLQKINLPYIDLSQTNKKRAVTEYIVNMFRDDQDLKDNIYDRLLYRLIVVKLSENSYKLYMPVAHVIFDGMSGEIIESSLRSIYNNNGDISNRNIIPFDNYIEQIKKGPVAIDEHTIIDTFGLSDFKKAFDYHLQNNNKKNIVRSYIFLKNDWLQDKDNRWEIAYKLFVRLLEFNYPQDSIPYAIIHIGRKYENLNYYNTMGLFIDIIPFHLDHNDPLGYTRISEMLELVNRNNLNFLALADDENRNYRQVNELFNTENILKDGILPIFNYLGIYDNLDLINELSDLKPKSRIISKLTQKAKGPNIVNVLFKKGEVMMSVFCERSKRESLEKELQSYLDLLLEEIAKGQLVMT